MNSIILEFYKRASTQKNAHEKSLANYLFREIIEDVHSKYNISQEDMKAMNKMAVNRAALYLKLCENPKMKKAFLIESLHCLQWDEPEITEEIKEDLQFFEKLSKRLD